MMPGAVQHEKKLTHPNHATLGEGSGKNTPDTRRIYATDKQGLEDLTSRRSRPFRRLSIALTLASTIALAACATSSHMLIGAPRPAIAPEEVSVLPQVPEQFEEIAEIEASSGASLRSAQDKLDLAIEALQKEAARLGANAILSDDDDPGAPAVSAAIRQTSTTSDGSAVDLGFGSSSRLSEFVRGLAIYVPPEGGTFFIPVIVNGTMTLDFSVDSGVAEVTIPADVLETLRRTGTIAEADLLEPGEYELADGSSREQTRFRIRTLKVGDTELRDVVASVSPIKGYLVLGRSLLSQVGTLTWSVDNQRHVLVLNGNIASAPRSEPDYGEGAPAGIPDKSAQVTELMRPRGTAQTTTQAAVEPDSRAQAKEANRNPPGTRAEKNPPERAEGNSLGKATGVLREP